ncbi:hypothetical protein DAPPUDRAFT_341130, partial [Daphnia pulex]
MSHFIQIEELLEEFCLKKGLTFNLSLQQALALEAKFQPKLQLLSTASNTGVRKREITCAMRDGAAHVLRSLKVWYDLPSAVLLHALNMMDWFHEPHKSTSSTPLMHSNQLLPFSRVESMSMPETMSDVPQIDEL